MKIQKLILASVALSATLLFGTSCSNGSDDTGPNPPVVPDNPLTPGTDPRPDWDQYAVDYLRYDSEMPVVIGIQSELASYTSDKDMMRATIGGETRACSVQPLEWESTSGTASRKFMLTVGGNAGEGSVTLQYYCDQLHRTFTVSNWKNYDASTTPTEGGQPYIPLFYTR